MADTVKKYPINNHLVFMDKHKIHGPILREFVFKELWKPAIFSCRDLINVHKLKIALLEDLEMALYDEMNSAK